MTSAGGLDPIALSAVLLLVVSMLSRFWLIRHPRLYFVIQVAVFSFLTFLLKADNIVPYIATNPSAGPLTRHLLVAGLEIAWWLGGAWLLRGFLRTFVVLGGKPRESTLLQELLGALIYLAAIVGIVAYVLDWPIKGVLATSGALAIIIGLALQSTLGDAFSGIVLNLERPYRVGDWIIVDSTVQGSVIETNWRATHIKTPSNDTAIVPNSIIAKSQIVNCSALGQLHNSSATIRLDRSLSPDSACDLMKDVLLGASKIIHVDDPFVTVKGITADAVEYALGFAVSDVTLVDKVKADILRRAFYAISVAGAAFAVDPASGGSGDTGKAKTAQLLEAIPLFDPLTAAERDALLGTMLRQVYAAGTTVAQRGTVMQSLHIVSRGVLIEWEEVNGAAVESCRLTPGFYFGEMGLLTGAPLSGDVTAVRQTIIYQISKEALAPILKARPAVADLLAETLELHDRARRSALNHHASSSDEKSTIAARLADTIRHLFSLH